MTVKRTCWGVLVVLVLTGWVHAGLDIAFVDGLAQRRYYHLAIAHLEKMRNMTEVPPEDKTVIPLRLGRIYNALAADVRDADQKENYLTQAAKYLSEFATRNPSHPEMIDVSLQRVDIESKRAQAVTLGYERETDVKKRDDLRKRAEDLYQKALDAAGVIVEKTTASEKTARQKLAANPGNKALQKTFWFHYGAQVRGLFMLGHLEYLWGQLYPEKAKERKTHLDASVRHFETTAARNPKTNVTYESYVRRGMCLRELAVFERDAKKRIKILADSMKAFEAALTVQVTPQTKSTRAEAHYQKALTAMVLKDYEAAVAGADGYLRESPTGKESSRGQRVLLVKADALARVALKQLADPDQKGDWEGIYNLARSTLRDILPKFKKIRQEADELVQSWAPLFPKKAEVVISPLIAASDAQRLLKGGNLAGAVDMYREVINLSVGRQQFAAFEEEAWKTLGNIYYRKRRLYMAAIAWHELVARFPETRQGAELAWVRTKIFAFLYTQSKQKDDFDLEAYLDSLKFFITTYPKHAQVYEAQTEIAKVYALQGKTVAAAEIWGSTDPENPRYAEAMLNAGELYRQAFFKLADAGQADTPEAKKYLDACVKNLNSASTAPLPTNAAVNYNAEALLRLAELLADDAVPASYAPAVLAVLPRFRERFGTDRDRLAKVLLATVRAHVKLKQLPQAETLALELERDHPETESYALAVQVMVVAYQQAGNGPKANAWRKKQITDPESAPIGRLSNAARQSAAQKEWGDATRFYAALVKRLPGVIAGLSGKPDPTEAEQQELTKMRELMPVAREEYAAVLFDSKNYAGAVRLYGEMLKEIRAALKQEETDEGRAKLLTWMKRLAESEELGGDAKRAIALWEEFSTETFRRPKPPDEWYNARYHLACAYAKDRQYKSARDVLNLVEAFGGGFDQGFEKYPDLPAKVKALRERIK